MVTLTVDELILMGPDEIFAHGWHRRIGSWVAIRGGIHDWAVYAIPGPIEDSLSPRDISERGDKQPSNVAGLLVHADKEALAMYRGF